MSAMSKSLEKKPQCNKWFGVFLHHTCVCVCVFGWMWKHASDAFLFLFFLLLNSLILLFRRTFWYAVSDSVNLRQSVKSFYLNCHSEVQRPICVLPDEISACRVSFHINSSLGHVTTVWVVPHGVPLSQCDVNIELVFSYPSSPPPRLLHGSDQADHNAKRDHHSSNWTSTTWSKKIL